MTHALANVSTFLIQTLFELYLLVLLLRILLAVVHADFYHPLSQFILTVTNPPLRPLRRVFPMLGRLDLAAIVLAVCIKLVELSLLQLLLPVSVPFLFILPLAIVELLRLLVYIYIFSLIIEAVLSWVNPGMSPYQNPTATLLYQLNAPLLRPIRQIVPTIGMVDLSPLAAIIGLNIVLILLQSLL